MLYINQIDLIDNYSEFHDDCHGLAFLGNTQNDVSLLPLLNAQIKFFHLPCKRLKTLSPLILSLSINCLIFVHCLKIQIFYFYNCCNYVIFHVKGYNQSVKGGSAT